MNSELKILKVIWEKQGKGSVQLLSKQTGLGIGYTQYICDYLSKKGKIKPAEQGYYEVTSKGKKQLKPHNLISERDRTGQRSGKSSLKDSGRADIKEESIRAEEEKLDLGEAIEKAVSLLEKSPNQRSDSEEQED